jgi:hypothetical protein
MMGSSPARQINNKKLLASENEGTSTYDAILRFKMI